RNPLGQPHPAATRRGAAEGSRRSATACDRGENVRGAATGAAARARRAWNRSAWKIGVERLDSCLRRERGDAVAVSGRMGGARRRELPRRERTGDSDEDLIVEAGRWERTGRR